MSDRKRTDVALTILLAVIAVGLVAAAVGIAVTGGVS